MKLKNLVCALLAAVGMASCTAESDAPMNTEEATFSLEKTFNARSIDYQANGKNSLDLSELPPISIKEAENILQFIGGIDKSFQKMLFEYIDKKGMTDVQVYKAANVSKKVFSDIRCDPNYHPSKATAISFALSLHLGLEDTERLLRSAGYSLSKSFEIDVVIEYFIKTGKYKDVLDVNEYLYEFGLEPLGCLKERKKEKA